MARQVIEMELDDALWRQPGHWPGDPPDLETVVRGRIEAAGLAVVRWERIGGGQSAGEDPDA